MTKPGPIALKNRVPVSGNVKDRQLSDKEKQITKKLGYDEKILNQIVKTLDPEIGVVTATMDGEFENPSEGKSIESFVFRGSDVGTAPLLDKDLENYRSIERQYPELKDLVEREIALHQNLAMRNGLPTSAQKISAETRARADKFAQTARRCSALLRQDGEDKNTPIETDSYVMVSPPDYSSEEDVNKKIAILEGKVKGLVLRDENKPRPIIGLRYKTDGSPIYGNDKRLELLQKELDGTSYQISSVGRNKVDAKTFETIAEAERFLSSYGLTQVDMIVLTEQPARKYEEKYEAPKESKNIGDGNFQSGNLNIKQPRAPLDMVMKIMSGGTMRILPGTKVTKLGDNRWSLDQPERYEARAPIMNAILMKVPKDDFGLTLIKAEGTNGINYSLDTNKIIAKLKEWNTKYGISVLSATYESMTVKFKNLPPDLDPLLSEAIAFDPDLNDCGSEDQAKQTLADELNRTGAISFWWD